VKKTKKSKSGNEFEPFIEIGLGYNSNLFQSPKTIIGSSTYGTQRDLVKNDNFQMYAAGLNYLKKIDKQNRFKMDYRYETEKYSSFNIMDNSSHDLHLDYRQKRSKNQVLKIEADYEEHNKNETNIMGDEYNQKYSYKEYRLSPTFTQKFASGIVSPRSGKTSILLTLKAKQKDYEEPLAPTESLDYTQYSGLILLTQPLSDSLKLKLGFDYRSRIYLNDTAKSWSGSDAQNEKRNQIYRIYRVGLKKKINKKSQIKINYKKWYRIDLYDGYYTYNSQIYEVDLKYGISTKTYLTFDFEYESRHYEKQVVTIIGLPLLEYGYYDVTVGFLTEIMPYADLEFEYRLDRRDATDEVESSLYERSYTGDRFFLGLHAHF